MDESRSTFDWMRSHRRVIAGSMLGILFLPALLALGFGLWVLGRHYPEWFAVFALLALLVLARVRRERGERKAES